MKDSQNAVTITHVDKYYGSVKALDDISLHVADNEFFTLLGPSGCGKTTLLRLLAGFEDVNQGDIFLYGERLNDIPAYARPINTVFQNYALFPHMNVLQNVGFGLEMLGHKKQQVNTRAMHMLELVRLQDFALRRVGELSGGQQQRVALARALAPQPKLLLLDESLSALDLKLRQAMRRELKQIQRETGITFIFVTHDQDEALTMSDRIAVMADGVIQQIGTAKEIYGTPTNRFVADFIGETNLLPVHIKEVLKDQVACAFADGHLVRVPHDGAGASVGGQAYLSVRPEAVRLSAEASPESVKLQVQDIVYSGAVSHIYLCFADGTALHALATDTEAVAWQKNHTVYATLEERAMRLLLS